MSWQRAGHVISRPELRIADAGRFDGPSGPSDIQRESHTRPVLPLWDVLGTDRGKLRTGQARRDGSDPEANPLKRGLDMQNGEESSNDRLVQARFCKALFASNGHARRCSSGIPRSSPVFRVAQLGYRLGDICDFEISSAENMGGAVQFAATPAITVGQVRVLFVKFRRCKLRRRAARCRCSGCSNTSWLLTRVQRVWSGHVPTTVWTDRQPG